MVSSKLQTGMVARLRASLRVTLFSSLFSGLVGCGFDPQPLVHYTNQDPDTVWVQGLEVHRYHEPSLNIAVAFHEYSYEILKYGDDFVHPISFIVDIQNHSPSPILIDPNDFLLTTKKEDSIFLALDPEKVLKDYDRQIRSTQADMDSHSAIEGGFLLLDFAFNTVSLATDVKTIITDPPKVSAQKLARNQKTEAEFNQAVAKRKEDYAKYQLELHNQLKLLTEVKSQWSQTSLRKHTLTSGATLCRTLAFPMRGFPLPSDLILKYRHQSQPQGRHPSFTLGHFHLKEETVKVERP